MSRVEQGISIMEAALAIGVIAIVSIGILSLLGNNINITYTKSNDNFKAYKPFDWGSPSGSGKNLPTAGGANNSSSPKQGGTNEYYQSNTGTAGSGMPTANDSGSPNTSASDSYRESLSNALDSVHGSFTAVETAGTNGNDFVPIDNSPGTTTNLGSSNVPNSGQKPSNKKPTAARNSGLQPRKIGGTTGIPSSGTDNSQPVLPDVVKRGGIKTGLIGVETSGGQAKAQKNPSLNSPAPAQF